MFTANMVPLSKAKQKWIRSLHLKKNREEAGVFVVEGEKSVLEGIEYFSQNLELLVVLDSEKNILPESVAPLTHTISQKELEQISELKTPNKFLAVFKRLSNDLIENERSLVLDGIQDPGNMGTILRLADWYGIKQIICSKDTVDCYNPKVIQASMGAIYRIPVHYIDLIPFLKTTKQPKFGAMLKGTNYREVNYQANALLIMGNEGKGVRPEIEAFFDVPVTIPRFGEAESLNVATATAILLAEMVK